MSIRQTIVNLNPSDGVPAVRVNQYDLGVTLVFVVLDGTAPAEFPSGTTCTLQGTRPSGTGYSIACELADNIVTIDTTIEMTREYGDSTCELRFVRNGTDMGTGNFKLGVEKAAFANDTIDENVNHWNALAQQVHADTVVATRDAQIATQAAQDSTEAKETALKAEQSALLAAKRAQDYSITAKEAGSIAADQAIAKAESRLASYITSAQTARSGAEAAQSAAASSAQMAAMESSDAEAYAVGKRNGVDVPSTDPTYHNNAKYWAETLSVDDTLTQSGRPADSKVVGDKIDSLRDDLDSIIQYVYTDIPTVGTTLFTTNDVKSGEVIDYSFVLRPTDYNNSAGYITLYSTNDGIIQHYGRTTSQDETTIFNGEFTIPANFSYAKWNGSISPNSLSIKKGKGSNDDVVKYSVQSLTLEQQSQARANIGFIEDKILIENLFFGSATNGTVLFTSDSIPDDSYHIRCGIEIRSSTGYAYIEFLDENNQRLGVFGRTSSYDTSTQWVTGDYKIPTGCKKAIWNSSGAIGMGSVDLVKPPEMYGGVRYDVPQALTEEQIKQAKNNLCIIDQSEKLVFSGNAINGQRLFTSGDLNGASKIFYNFDVNYANDIYPAGYIALFDSSNTRLSWVGRGATGNKQVSFIGSIDIPENFSYAMWTSFTQGTVTGNGYIRFIKITSSSGGTSILVSQPYQRFEIKKHGTLYNGYPHLAFPRICAFDNKMVILYRCSMRHEPEGYTGIWQIDTVDMSGQYTHVRTIAPSDIADVPENYDSRDAQITPSPDGEFLIISGGYLGGTYGSYVSIMAFIVLDKSFNIVDYKLIDGTRDYPYGNLLFTPSGKMIFSYFNQSLTDSGIYRTNEAFDGKVSTLTYEKTNLFTPSNTGASRFSECCMGYYNDKLVIALRIESSINATPIRVTTDLEGESGWGNVISINGVMAHSPVLLPYYKGKYLPFMCSQNLGNYNRIPVFAYIDLENNKYLCYKNIDTTLQVAFNGYPWFIRLFDETYAMVYYQEGTSVASSATPEQSNTGLYYRWINAKLFFPQLSRMEMDWQE